MMLCQILYADAPIQETWDVYRDFDGVGRVTHVRTGRSLYIFPQGDVFAVYDDFGADPIARQQTHTQAVCFCKGWIADRV